MSDNGQEWVWYVAVIESMGDVCFQKSGDQWGKWVGIRRMTTIQATAGSKPGTTDFEFRPHMFHVAGIYPETLVMRADQIVRYAKAPEKVCAVLEEEWNPKTIVSATPEQVNRLTKLGDPK